MSALDGLHEEIRQPAATRDPAALEARLTRIDWPTLLLAIGVYAGFALLTWFAYALPWWAILPLGAILVCLQSSLQHEAIHGYPTPWRWVNYALAAPALWLWLPYGINRAGHLRHHSDENLTDPARDPESNYLTPEQWARLSAPHRAIRQLMSTLLGRIVVGPLYYAALAFRDLGVAILRRDRAALGHWALHGLVVAALLGWVIGVCRLSLAEYLLLFVWPGTGLALIRSFAEHRAAPDVAARTATIEAGPLMSFLFLNNNLHALHHADPTAPWHARPARYRQERAAVLARSRYHLLPGYAHLFRNFLLDAKEPLLHPAARAARPATRDHQESSLAPAH
jgi:fatty acid desaturase